MNFVKKRNISRLRPSTLKLAFLLFIILWISFTLYFFISHSFNSLDNNDGVADEDDNELPNHEENEENLIENDEEEDEIYRKPISHSPVFFTSALSSSTANTFWSQAFSLNPAVFTRVESVWNPHPHCWFVFDHCSIFSPQVQDRIRHVCCRPLPPNFHDQVELLRNRVYSSSLWCFSSLGSVFAIPQHENDWVLVMPNEKNDLQIMSFVNANRYQLMEQHQRPVKMIRVERNPLLLRNRVFALRTWLFPTGTQTFFALGHILLSDFPFDASSTNPKSFLASRFHSDVCLDELMLTMSSEWKATLERMKRIVLFLRQSFFPVETSQVLLMWEPQCVDFSWDADSRLWLRDWKPWSECRESSPQQVSPSCQTDFVTWENMAHFVQGTHPPPDKRIHVLEDLAPCTEEDTQYKRTMDVRIHVQHTVLLALKESQASFQNDDDDDDNNGVVCTTCAYSNRRTARHCDVCGHRLDTSSSTHKKISTTHKQVAQVGKGFEQRLIRLFERFDPSRLTSVNVLLERYRGEEEALIQRVESQYLALFDASGGDDSFV